MFLISKSEPGQVQLRAIDERIAHGEQIVARQRGLVARLARNREASHSARELLDEMVRCLSEMKKFRQVVLRTMGYPPVRNPPSVRAVIAGGLAESLAAPPVPQPRARSTADRIAGGP